MHVQVPRYKVHAAVRTGDIEAAQALRAQCFGLDRPLDEDAFDQGCTHVVLRALESGAIVCTFRMLCLSAAEIGSSYSAQHYDLSALRGFEGQMLELGRFCIDPNVADPDVLRVAWAAMTGFVDQNDVKLLFGSTSFAGTQPAPYVDAFALLRARYLAPEGWAPRRKAPDVVRFATARSRKPGVKTALAQMPPLLRGYLRMGAWVSDHAVVDPQMNTMHVFTGLEVGAIPAPRKRLLRAMAQDF